MHNGEGDREGEIRVFRFVAAVVIVKVMVVVKVSEGVVTMSMVVVTMQCGECDGEKVPLPSHSRGGP